MKIGVVGGGAWGTALAQVAATGGRDTLLWAIEDEVVRINTETRPRALQVALLVPILAALIGLANSFRMVRLPEPEVKSDAEGMAFG